MDAKQRISIIICVAIVFLALVSHVPYISKRLSAHMDSLLGYVQKAPTIRVTIPEGSTNVQIAAILSSKIQNFDTQTFLASAASEQGYLFPDTYFFTPNESTDSILLEMENNFAHKAQPILNSSTMRSQKDILIMASILEGEATHADMEIVSGILWKRVDSGMFLEADADPQTYTKKGLPLIPISNPGTFAIKAAMYPVASPYLFYLYDKNGMIHLATTFAEHKKNIALYLR